jgi:hypothetical protein
MMGIECSKCGHVIGDVQLHNEKHNLYEASTTIFRCEICRLGFLRFKGLSAHCHLIHDIESLPRGTTTLSIDGIPLGDEGLEMEGDDNHHNHTDNNNNNHVINDSQPHLYPRRRHNQPHSDPQTQLLGLGPQKQQQRRGGWKNEFSQDCGDGDDDGLLSDGETSSADDNTYRQYDYNRSATNRPVKNHHGLKIIARSLRGGKKEAGGQGKKNSRGPKGVEVVVGLGVGIRVINLISRLMLQ